MGSPAGGKAASIAYALIETAKLNGLDPQAWLADVLHRIPEHPSNRIDELLPWNCKLDRAFSEAAWSCKGGFSKRLRLMQCRPSYYLSIRQGAVILQDAHDDTAILR